MPLQWNLAQLQPLAIAGIAAVSLLGLGLGACSFGTDCDLMAVSSLSVNVADENGASIEDAAVRYSVDGGEFADCEDMGDSWVCGWEEAGNFEVEISAPGYETQTGTATIEQGECHVVPQSLDITLAEQDCTGEVVPGVILSLVDPEGNALGAEDRAWAEYGFADADMAPIYCEPYGESQFVCGWGQSGPFEISAGKIGYYPIFESVEVDFDGCHPITESVEVTMTPATTPCTEQVESSVWITVADTEGQQVPGAEVEFSPVWEDWFAPEPCYDTGEGVFQCGEEITGLLSVSVVAPGHASWTEQIFVTSDECHVIPVQATANLEAL